MMSATTASCVISISHRAELEHADLDRAEIRGMGGRGGPRENERGEDVTPQAPHLGLP